MMKSLIAGVAFALGLLMPLCSWAGAADIRQWTTPGGTRVVFLAAREIPMIDMSIDVDAGSRWDNPDRAGVAGLVSSMLSRGVRASGQLPAMTETEINEAIAELAIQRGGSVSLDRATISLRMLADPEVREKTARMISRMMFEPAFDREILDREKKRTVAGLRESMTQPQSIATKALWRAIYPDHPYGMQATPESVESIAAADLVAFHQRYWQPNRMRITIVGALTESEARDLVAQLFTSAPSDPAVPSSPSRNQPATVTLKPKAVRLAIAHPATQSHLWLGMPGIARDDPDFFVLTVGNYILGGGGFVSRLTEEIREKRGLSYSVFSTFQPLAQPGPFLLSLQTQTAKAPEALAVVEQTLKKFLQEGPSEKELKAAKQNLVGGFALRLDTNRKLLDNLAQINYYDMPLDYLQTWTAKIERVSREDIRRVMKRVVTPEHLSVVVVAGPEGFRP